ncbi:putative acetyltransferase [Posidoniimonas corsicana]|uniref:Putative acetyltransferase n=1 Tax=Posidoniimonas corsicana TaxID=1938618 RepID=A0A5C5VHA6_9BACT|nr:GNAT family N-acetyltransferase [Posidoniimonas corsicana]TWT37373.1 putative acetyltransferase [Posidoniimonas corsicana]
MTVKTRRATESDAKALAELLLAVHGIHVRGNPDVYRELSRDAAEAIVLGKLAAGERVRVAELDNEIAGYCAATIQTAPAIPLLQPRRSLYLNEVVVRPQSRKRGVGRALLEDLQAFARREGVHDIELDVASFNPEARAFFAAFGFQVLRERMGMSADS